MSPSLCVFERCNYDAFARRVVPSNINSLVILPYTSIFSTARTRTGPIPPEFGGLVSLKALYMEDNSLTGQETSRGTCFWLF